MERKEGVVKPPRGSMRNGAAKRHDDSLIPPSMPEAVESTAEPDAKDKEITRLGKIVVNLERTVIAVEKELSEWQETNQKLGVDLENTLQNGEELEGKLDDLMNPQSRRALDIQEELLEVSQQDRGCLNAKVALLNGWMTERDQAISEKDEELVAKDQVISERDHKIRAMKKKMRRLEHKNEEKMVIIKGKQKMIRSKLRKLDRAADAMDEKDKKIAELEQQVRDA